MSRGVFTSRAPVKIGTVWLTGYRDVANAAGSLGGIPCEVAWPNIHQHDPNPGTTDFAADGTPYNQRFPRGEKGRLVELRVTYLERATYDLLVPIFASDATFALEIYHRWATWIGTAKPLRPNPLSSGSGDHRWAGAKARETIIKMVALTGAFSAPAP